MFANHGGTVAGVIDAGTCAMPRQPEARAAHVPSVEVVVVVRVGPAEEGPPTREFRTTAENTSKHCRDTCEILL